MASINKFIVLVFIMTGLGGCAMTPSSRQSDRVLPRIDEHFSTRGLVNPQRVVLPDGSIYIGEVLNGQPHGHGKLNFTNGAVYIGEFAQGYPSGSGKLQTHTGIYTGNIVDGLPHGFGLSNNEDGSTYEGEHVRGVFEGRGKLTLSDGTFFIGYFKANKVDRGTLVLTDNRELQLK